MLYPHMLQLPQVCWYLVLCTLPNSSSSMYAHFYACTCTNTIINSKHNHEKKTFHIPIYPTSAYVRVYIYICITCNCAISLCICIRTQYCQLQLCCLFHSSRHTQRSAVIQQPPPVFQTFPQRTLRRGDGMIKHA